MTDQAWPAVVSNRALGFAIGGRLVPEKASTSRVPAGAAPTGQHERQKALHAQHSHGTRMGTQSVATILPRRHVHKICVCARPAAKKIIWQSVKLRETSRPEVGHPNLLKTPQKAR